MKKGLTIISLIVGIAASGYALFQLLTNKENGKEDAQNDSKEAGIPAEKEAEKGEEA